LRLSGIKFMQSHSLRLFHGSTVLKLFMKLTLIKLFLVDTESKQKGLAILTVLGMC
jgi:hypothetical protein